MLAEWRPACCNDPNETETDMNARFYGIVLVSTALLALPSRADSLTPDQQRAYDIYKELVEIDTTTATGDTRQAADAMAARLKAGVAPEAGGRFFPPAPRRGNLVPRRKERGGRKPILLVAHLDVVPA